ncbi:glycosyltransferase family 4 protein [Salinimicrobium sp. GXAS 041]|uniref:glycosyltransferase family 4 protein n=1 Tax=Salinimicrobium sp. GXAS 041 TaxID=3400806 RepID=UPI003C790334
MSRQKQEKNKNESLNVLHLSAVKNWGGGGNQIENLCYELSKTNPEVKNLIVIGANGRFEERLKDSDFNYCTIPLKFKIDPRAVYKLIRLCKKEKIDLIHLHGSTSLTLAVIADKIKKLPPFIFSKKTSFPIKDRKITLYKYNYPNIKKILCVSDAVKKISASSIKDTSKLKTIYHGTRIDNKDTKTPFQLREKFSIPKAHKIVGTIGNHVKPKDLNTWIDTIDIIVNKLEHKGITFIQIGSFTGFTPSLKERIKELQLEKHVHFLGYMNMASNFMKQFDVFLLTSQSEGLPQVIYEAFYHRTPVVSTEVGGVNEIITNGKNGLMAASKDAENLAKNVIRILQDKQLADSFKQRSYEILIPKYTSENMAKETLEQYREIINSLRT